LFVVYLELPSLPRVDLIQFKSVKRDKMFYFFKKIKELHNRFKAWKPIHLCWWFEKHGLPIPPYLIGGRTETSQLYYVIGRAARFANNPDDVYWKGGSSNTDCNLPWNMFGRGMPFHIRIAVGETTGNSVTFTPALFYNTTNDPSTAIQVTTDGSSNALRITTCDSHIYSYSYPDWDGYRVKELTCDVPDGFDTWGDDFVDGHYIEESDLFPSITLTGQYTILHACIEFTDNAIEEQTYYFWIKQADGTPLTAYNIVPQQTCLITCTNNLWYNIAGLRILNTTWEIEEFTGSLLTSSWQIKDRKSFETGWEIEASGERLTVKWSINNTFTKVLSWKIGRYEFDTGWAVQNDTYQVFSWWIQKTTDKEIAWEVPRASYDVEWERVDTATLIGSLTDVAATNVVLTGLRTSVEYRWRVRVHDLDGNGTPSVWSYWKHFITEPQKLPVFWAIVNTDTYESAWRIKEENIADTSWVLFNQQAISPAYGILTKAVQDKEWLILDENKTDTTWVIEKIIPPPTNLNTIEITETSAKFIWEGV